MKRFKNFMRCIPKGMILFFWFYSQVYKLSCSGLVVSVLVFSFLFKLPLTMLCTTLLTSLHAVGCCSCNSLLGSSRNFHQKDQNLYKRCKYARICKKKYINSLCNDKPSIKASFTHRCTSN